MSFYPNVTTLRSGICYRKSICLSVMFVRPTQGIEAFGNMENYGRWAFLYTGPHAWNSLPEHLRQTTSNNLFKRSLEAFLFGHISHSAH